jgi:hypothetical protein
MCRIITAPAYGNACMRFYTGVCIAVAAQDIWLIRNGMKPDSFVP